MLQSVDFVLCLGNRSPFLVSLCFLLVYLCSFFVLSSSEWVWLWAFWLFHCSAPSNRLSSFWPQALPPVLITRPSGRVIPRRLASKVATSCSPMNTRETSHSVVWHLNKVIVMCTISVWVVPSQIRHCHFALAWSHKASSPFLFFVILPPTIFQLQLANRQGNWKRHLIIHTPNAYHKICYRSC